MGGAPLVAVCFDLYDTLLKIRDRRIHRGVPRLLGVPPRPWLDLVRSELLVQPFASIETWSEHVCRRLRPGADERYREGCAELCRAELASVEALPGTLSMLRFLQRRGVRLALASNLTSLHKEPLQRLGLGELFEVGVFSCDLGHKKPEPELYAEVIRRLGVPAERVLFVGDSAANDVEGPLAAGMRALHVAGESSWPRVDRAADVGWLRLDDDTMPDLLPRQLTDAFGGRLTVRAIEPVSDEEQGRYNLVRRLLVASGEDPSGSAGVAVVYCKRYLLPETAHLEAFAYQVARFAGVSPCTAWVLEGAEPVLAVTEAPGTKYAGELDAGLAREIGRQLAFAYLLANGDIRPRNAILDRESGSLTMIDLEHCFFNLALELEGLTNPFSARALDAVGTAGLEARLKRQVLSDRANRRARRIFVDDEPAARHSVDLRRGFVELYSDLQARRRELIELLEQRIYADPPLIVGTRGYRRAMCGIDLADIARRLGEDPDVVLDRSFF